MLRKFVLLVIVGVSQCSRYPQPNYLALLLASASTVSQNPVKSVYSFVTNVATNPTLMTVPAVDTTRAFVMCSYRLANTSFQTNRVPICSLTSSTQVTVQAGTSDAGVLVRGYVVEFSTGVNVQRGAFTLAGGTLNNTVSISPVSQNRSFVIVQSRTTDTGTLIDEHRTVMGYLQSSSSLYVVRNQATIITDVEYQVIEMQGATVQYGISQIPGGSFSVSIPIAAVNTSKSFVVFSSAADNLSNGNDSEMAVRCDLANASQLLCQRQDSTNAPDIAWYVVSFADSTYVERGSADTNVFTPPANNTDTSMTVTPSVPFDLTRTLPIGSTASDPGDADAGLDSASFTQHLLTSTQLNIQRGSADDRRSVASWQLIQFPAR